MQTFKFGLQLQVTAVIMQQFLDEARKEAQKPDASLFLKTMQERFPDDDDAFMAAIVKNALRTTIKHQTVDFLMKSGVGGRVSPVQIISEEIQQRKDAVAEFAECSKDGAIVLAQNLTVQQLRIEKDSPDVHVAGLIEHRAE